MSRHGENIRKRKDGRWEARIIENHSDGKSKYRYVYARSYAEAKEKRNQLLKESIPKASSAKCRKSLNYLSKLWLDNIKISVKESTHTRYIRCVEKYILPYFESMQLQKIDISCINSFTKHLLEKGGKNGGKLSPKTVLDILIVLKCCLSYGKSCGYPCPDFSMIQHPKMTKDKISIISKSDKDPLDNLLWTSNDILSLGILITRYTGIRIGELCGLQWSDVDLRNGLLHISKTVERISNNGISSPCKTKVIISKPKTDSSHRIIPLVEPILNRLVEFKANPSFFLMSQGEKPTEPHTLYIRYKRYLKRNGLGNYTFHALRHTFATDCVEKGVDAKTISEILGHSNVTTTLKCYVHPTMESKKAQLEQLLASNIHGQNCGQS